MHIPNRNTYRLCHGFSVTHSASKMGDTGTGVVTKFKHCTEPCTHTVVSQVQMVSYFKIVLSVWTGFFFIFNNFLIILNLNLNFFSELFI